MAKRRSSTGRITPSKREREAEPLAPRPATRTSGGRGAPAASPRYTPRAELLRLRPRWHRFAGWAGILLGLLIAIANDAMLIGEDLTLLPGGHSELYLMMGIGVAGASTWFLGIFDRGTTVYE